MSVAEDFANPEACISGLTAEKQYYVRLKLKNEKGGVEQTRFLSESANVDEEVESFVTPTEKPVFVGVKVSEVTATSAHFVGEFQDEWFGKQLALRIYYGTGEPEFVEDSPWWWGGFESRSRKTSGSRSFRGEW